MEAPTTSAPAGTDQFAEFDTHMKNYALEDAAKALEMSPSSVHESAEYLHRAAELEIARAGRCVDKSDEQWSMMDHAMTLAEKAHAADPTSAKANEVLASALGLKMFRIKDHRGKLDAVWRLIDLCDTAIEADPTLPTPYHIKGRVQLQVSSIGSAARYGASWIHPKGCLRQMQKRHWKTCCLQSVG